MKRRNDPSVMAVIPELDPVQWHRFLPRISAGHPDGCWIWEGAKTVRGYGIFWLDHKVKRYVHRIMFVTFRGAIPFGTELHHACESEGCMNPFHMEPVDFATNIALRNASNGWAKHAANEVPF